MALVNSPKVNGDQRVAVTLTAAEQAAGTNDLGFKTPLEWFPNLMSGSLPSGTEFFLRVNSNADRDQLKAVADGQRFGLIATFRQYDNGDPATGNVVNEVVSSAATTQDAADGITINPTKSPNAILPADFKADSIGFQVIVPTTGTPLASLRLYAL